MDTTATLHALRTLSIEEQLEFLSNAWDQLLDDGWQPELSEELPAELDRRLAAHQENPGNVLTWEQVVERVRRPR